jgi:hypothetical protein
LFEWLVAEIVHLLGYSVGTVPGARLMKRFGIPVSDGTILQQFYAQYHRSRYLELHS